MGLDITAKSKIVTKKESPEAYEFNMLLDADTDTLYINPDFAGHMAEYNSSDNKDNIVDYVATEDSKTHSFKAGSYSSYNQFRNIVSKALIGKEADAVWDDPNTYKNHPAFMLIDFSDCEGCMDSVTCSKLLKDFTENREKFVDYLKNSSEVGDMDTEHYTELYDNWITAFTLAADEGVLIFA